MVRILPTRLKSHNGKNGGDASPSRGPSPIRAAGDGKSLVLKTTVLKVGSPSPALQSHGY